MLCCTDGISNERALELTLLLIRLCLFIGSFNVSIYIEKCWFGFFLLLFLNRVIRNDVILVY